MSPSPCRTLLATQPQQGMLEQKGSALQVLGFLLLEPPPLIVNSSLVALGKLLSLGLSSSIYSMG